MEREVLALLVLVPDHVMRTGDDARRTPGAQPARDDLRVELLPLRGPALGHRPNIEHDGAWLHVVVPGSGGGDRSQAPFASQAPGRRVAVGGGESSDILVGVQGE